MKQKSFTQEPLVIKKPSKSLVDLMDKLRDRKESQLKELHGKRDFYFPNKKK